MDRGSDLDIEKGSEDVPSVVPLLVDDGPKFRRQRTAVSNVEPFEESEPVPPPRPVDYTFRGRHIELIAIGISHASMPG